MNRPMDHMRKIRKHYHKLIDLLSIHHECIRVPLCHSLLLYIYINL